MPPTKSQIVVLGVLVVGMALLIGHPGSSEANSGLLNVKDRRPAPDFILKDSKGVPIKLSDYEGKVVLLNFWATWCGPCKAEIPWFVVFESKYKGMGFAVLGVSMDEDGWKAVQPFQEQAKMNYTVMLGDEATASKFGGVDSLPQTFLIDRKGRIAAKQIGLTSQTTYREEIVELLRPTN
jgi:cytochrome c biogenesis protein CcmG/thiol:disulfide interchange protein DsbE